MGLPIDYCRFAPGWACEKSFHGDQETLAQSLGHQWVSQPTLFEKGWKAQLTGSCLSRLPYWGFVMGVFLRGR